MPKEVMHRSASDNEYLHKDFHGALSVGINYLEEKYGPEAVREYLREFTNTYFAPLKEDLQTRGLVALKEHFEKVYQIEGGDVSFEFGEDELVLKVAACPAVMHMRERGLPVANMFDETTRTVNETLCQGSDFDAELVEYDPQTGKSIQRFFRRVK